MPMKFTLDFSIETSQGRLDYINQHIDFSQLSKKDIELCTDYVLYGKDPEHDNTSIVDRKEVYMKTKYQSYSRPEPVSLEALMESPTFDETIFKNEKNIYKRVKPTIDREKCKDIPGMQELWDQIDKLSRKIQLAEGKIQPEEGESVPTYTSKELYHLKHRLIELRKEQYQLKDTVFPEMQVSRNYGSAYVNPADTHMNYPVYPCGVMKEQNDPDFKCPARSPRDFTAKNIEEEIEQLKQSGKPYFSFLDKEHIYQLCLNYYDIKDQIQKYPDSPLHNLLWTLDFYIEKANLSEQQLLIVEGKKRRLLNKEICKELMDKLGIYHQENYISTIWNKVTQLIADAADLNYDEWCCKDYAPAWKKCNQCGETLLRDPRNFVRKSKALDGLTNRCKRCDQKKRRGEI